MKKIYSQGEIIRLIRTLLGHSESKMASMLGMTQSNYSYLETHRETFDNKLLEEIAHALEVSRDTLENFNPDALLDGSESNQKDVASLTKEANERAKSKGSMLVLQKEEIMALKKNIVGLRRQLQEQNETISELRNVIRDQQHAIKGLRKLLVQKLGGGKSYQLIKMIFKKCRKKPISTQLFCL
ncbi:MAG: helix-turn-helix domain-containing protein, partial [Chitinophagaceae bacterium]